MQLGFWSLLSNGLLSAFYLILIVAVFAGNLLVIFAVIKIKRRHRSTHYFIVSLALADLLMVFGPIPLTGMFTLHGYWPFVHAAWCAIWIGSTIYLGSVSLYNLASLSVDRAIACLQPIRFRTTRSRNRLLPLIAISWFVPLILLLIPFSNGAISVSEAGRCNGPLELQFRIPVILVGFIVPCSVIIGANVCVLRVVVLRHYNKIVDRQCTAGLLSNLGKRTEFSKNLSHPGIHVLFVYRLALSFYPLQLSVFIGTRSPSPHLIPRKCVNLICFIVNMLTLISAGMVQKSILKYFVNIQFRLPSNQQNGIWFNLLAINGKLHPLRGWKHVGSHSSLSR